MLFNFAFVARVRAFIFVPVRESVALSNLRLIALAAASVGVEVRECWIVAYYSFSIELTRASRLVPVRMRCSASINLQVVALAVTFL